MKTVDLTNKQKKNFHGVCCTLSNVMERCVGKYLFSQKEEQNRFVQRKNRTIQEETQMERDKKKKKII